MALFKIGKPAQFTRTVTVIFPDDSEGDLQVTYRELPAAEFRELMSDAEDIDMCKRVVVSVGDIGTEDSDEKITGDDALEAVLQDTCALAAMASHYIEVMRTRNFRAGKPQKRR